MTKKWSITATTEKRADTRDDTYGGRVFFEFRILVGQVFEIGRGPVQVPRVHESVRRHDAARTSQADWINNYTVFTTIYFVYNNTEYLLANDYRRVLISGGARNSRTLLTTKYDTSAPRNGVRLFVYAVYVWHARACVRVSYAFVRVVSATTVYTQITQYQMVHRTKDCSKTCKQINIPVNSV